MGGVDHYGDRASRLFASLGLGGYPTRPSTLFADLLAAATQQFKRVGTCSENDTVVRHLRHI